jgi:hypothetical protein
MAGYLFELCAKNALVCLIVTFSRGRSRPIRCSSPKTVDFGEWIFAHREPSVGVVFTRYRPSEIDRISSIVLGLCTTKSEGLYGKFTTVTSRKTPTRGI